MVYRVTLTLAASNRLKWILFCSAHENYCMTTWSTSQSALFECCSPIFSSRFPFSCKCCALICNSLKCLGCCLSEQLNYKSSAPIKREPCRGNRDRKKQTRYIHKENIRKTRCIIRLTYFDLEFPAARADTWNDVSHERGL